MYRRKLAITAVAAAVAAAVDAAVAAHCMCGIGRQRRGAKGVGPRQPEQHKQFSTHHWGMSVTGVYCVMFSNNKCCGGIGCFYRDNSRTQGRDCSTVQ